MRFPSLSILARIAAALFLAALLLPPMLAPAVTEAHGGLTVVEQSKGVQFSQAHHTIVLPASGYLKLTGRDGYTVTFSSDANGNPYVAENYPSGEFKAGLQIEDGYLIDTYIRFFGVMTVTNDPTKSVELFYSEAYIR